MRFTGQMVWKYIAADTKLADRIEAHLNTQSCAANISTAGPSLKIGLSESMGLGKTEGR